MKILFDESLPKPLAKELSGYNVSTTVGKGWQGKKNGELLRLAQKEFDVFVTADQNLQYQQNLQNYKIAIIVLIAKANRLDHLKPLIPKVLRSIPNIKMGELLRIT